MNRGGKLLWGSFATIVLLALAFWLSSCGKAIPEPQRAQAASCIELASEALATVEDCAAAREAVARVVEKAPQCAPLLGLHLNLDGDGGPAIRCDD